jgi:hypothetical protein
MNKIVVVLSFLVFSLLFGQSNIASAAYNYNQGFTEYYGLNGIVSAKSPFRTSDKTVSLYSNVNSNNNQPRYINGKADLHNATDLRGGAGSDVYAIYAGYVSAKSEPSSTSNNGYITIEHVINGDSYMFRYYHVDPVNTLTVGQYVDANTKIADVDTSKSWPAHLDYGWKDWTPTGKSLKQYPFYRWVSEWDLGAYLDWFSGDVHSSGNMFYINCVSANTTGQTPCNSVKIYYKVGSGTTWQSKSLTPNSTGSNRFNIDFDTIASSGQTVKYYLVGTRSDNSTYYWAYFPQYYTFPGGPTLSDSYANTIARSYTVQ